MLGVRVVARGLAGEPHTVGRGAVDETRFFGPRDDARADARLLGEATAEADLRMVLDIEEVSAPEVLVASRLASPDPRRGDLPLKRRLSTTIEVELEAPVDVLEQAPHPGDHHVAGAKLGLGVSRLEDPSGHQPSLPGRAGATTNATSST